MRTLLRMTDTDTYDSAEDLLALGAAAKVAHCSPDTLRRWADKGEVPSIRTPGGQRRFRRGDLEALVS